MTYLEYAPWHPSGRGQLVELDKVPELQAKMLTADSPLYFSIYEFDDEVKEHFRIKKTIRNFKGRYALPRIILDIDKGTNSDDWVLQETRTRVKEMEDAYPWFPDNRIIWYSGTGYHIVIPEVFGFESSNTLPATVALTMKTVFPWTDNIFDGARILRAPFSLNNKNNIRRYKIPIPASVLLDETVRSQDIIAMAQQKPSSAPWYASFNLAEKPLSSKIASPRKPLVFNGAPKRSLAEVSSIVTCMQKIFAEGEIVGHRHERILRLASWLRRGGMLRAMTMDMLCKYAPSLDSLEIEKMVNDVYEHGYPYGCNDKILQQYCSEKCIHFTNKNYNFQMADAASMEQQFITFVNTEYGAKVVDLANYYTMHTYKIFPGELVVLIGDTKLGKSAWYQNLSVKVAPRKVIYFSLEVHQDLMFRRMLQIAHNKTKDEINEHYRSPNPASLTEPVNHILLSTHSPKLRDIVKTITEYSPDIVIIDTLDMVDAEVADPIQQVEVCAKRLKEIATKHNIIVMVVHHIAKANAIDEDGRQRPLTIHSGKYATALQQKADKVIGIEGVRGQPKRIIRSLGSRDETDFRLQFEVNWDTFIFNQVA